MANKITEKATIDVARVTVSVPKVGDTPAVELVMSTASKVAVTANIETQDAIKLIVKGVLKAQKPAQNVITGNTIVLSDNLFIPELVQVLQGGTIDYDDQGNVTKYTPPLVGSEDVRPPFTLNLYSAVYNAAAQITGYEKTSYPNCQGAPLAMSSEDNVFRAPEYTINSYPDVGQAPYTIEYVKELPAMAE